MYCPSLDNTYTTTMFFYNLNMNQIMFTQIILRSNVDLRSSYLIMWLELVLKFQLKDCVDSTRETNGKK